MSYFDTELVELASQGDLEALVSLIEESLEDAKIVKWEIKNSCLKLIIEAETLPEPEKIEVIVKDIIRDIEIAHITKLILYGRKTGEDFPEWTSESTVNNLKTNQQGESKGNTKPNSGETEELKNEFIKTLQTFKFSSIVPYKEVFNQELYRSNTVKLLLCFGLFPWIISSFATNNTHLKDIAWILGIYYAFIWGIVLHNLIKPPEFSLKEVIKCVGFTAFIGIPLLIFIYKVPPFSFLSAITRSSDSLARLTGYIIGVGLLEELCKALPIYLFMLRSAKLKEPLSSAFYGAMSGLGFAIAEGANYSLLYASQLVEGNIGLTGHILVTTVRFISLPLIHAIWAGIVGYFLGLAAINPSRQNAIIFIGVAIAAILHGVYNTFANSFIGLAILAFSILLFVTYLRRSKEMMREMKQAEADYNNS